MTIDRVTTLARSLTDRVPVSRRQLSGLVGLVAGMMTSEPILARRAAGQRKPSGKRKRCKQPKRRCGGTCVDVRTSLQHCGACGQECISDPSNVSTTRQCEHGVCRSLVPSLVREDPLAGDAGSGPLSSPAGLAVDADGLVYILDAGHDRIVVMRSDGSSVREFGTTGSGNGQLAYPQSIAIGGDRVYVADGNNHRIQVFSRSGRFLTKWGTLGSERKQFNTPEGVAVSGSRVYVADTRNHRIQVFDRNGKFITAWGTEGTGIGQFSRPTGLAATPDRVYVVDKGNHRVQVFARNGTYQRAFGTPGAGNGQFDLPSHIAVADNRIYVSDSDNGRIQLFDLAGQFLTLRSQNLSGPVGVAVQGTDVYVADFDTAQVEHFARGG